MTMIILTGYSIIIDIVIGRYQYIVKANLLDGYDKTEIRRNKKTIEKK